MASIVGLSILAVASAAVFGYLLCMLLCPDSAEESLRGQDELTEAGILRWVARRIVTDLANRRENAQRITVANVSAMPNTKSGTAFICAIKSEEWKGIVFKVQVQRSTMTRFSASVHCGENGHILFYNRAYELELAGLEEKIEMD